MLMLILMVIVMLNHMCTYEPFLDKTFASFITFNVCVLVVVYVCLSVKDLKIKNNN